MKKIISVIVLTFVLSLPAYAQDTFYSIFSYNYFIPKVQINDHTASLQKSIYPQIYKERAVAEDISWVQQNDDHLKEFWNVQGDTILHILTELAGIEWVEPEFDIYLVRNYPTLGSSHPLILPLGGINDGVKIEAVPDFDKLRLLLIYQLSKRMLLQVYEPQETVMYTVAQHPLMKESPYRLDNLAMLLAVNTAYSVLGVDTTMDVKQSRFWKNKFTGRKIFEDYFEKNWIITPDRPLADWIADESTRSKLVSVTRPPRKNTNIPTEKRHYLEDLPLKGKFGFSVKHSSSNQLVVTQIDMFRMAYAGGLRTDDIIKRVDGKIVRNQKQLIEILMESFNNGGSVVEIVREGQSLDIIIQPLEIDYLSDEYYFDEYNQEDSLYFDSISPEDLE